MKQTQRPSRPQPNNLHRVILYLTLPNLICWQVLLSVHHRKVEGRVLPAWLDPRGQLCVGSGPGRPRSAGKPWGWACGLGGSTPSTPAVGLLCRLYPPLPSPLSVAAAPEMQGLLSHPARLLADQDPGAVSCMVPSALDSPRQFPTGKAQFQEGSDQVEGEFTCEGDSWICKRTLDVC